MSSASLVQRLIANTSLANPPWAANWRQDVYNYVFVDPRAYAHPQTRDFFFMDPTYMMAFFVLFFVVVFGGKFLMRNRAPYKLVGYNIIHNFVLVALSATMAWQIFYECFVVLRCRFAGNHIADTERSALSSAIWLFFFSKLLEFFDTFGIVARKNYKQLSFLHVYHHCSVWVIWHITAHTAPGGDTYLAAGLNSLVHVFMYSYYFASTVKNSLAPESKWRSRIDRMFFFKHYLTQMQLLQFVVDISQAAYDVVFLDDYSHWLACVLFAYMISMLVLFGNFYVQNYTRGGRGANKKAKVVKDE